MDEPKKRSGTSELLELVKADPELRAHPLHGALVLALERAINMEQAIVEVATLLGA